MKNHITTLHVSPTKKFIMSLTASAIIATTASRAAKAAGLAASASWTTEAAGLAATAADAATATTAAATATGGLAVLTVAAVLLGVEFIVVARVVRVVHTLQRRLCRKKNKIFELVYGWIGKRKKGIEEWRLVCNRGERFLVTGNWLKFAFDIKNCRIMWIVFVDISSMNIKLSRRRN